MSGKKDQVTIGAPFNPYRVFQGAFAPFWLVEHRGLSVGAKLCYVRLLGFAGRDGHCYPSLETLGTSLGVSDRQARGYIRELEKAGLIAVKQRGLRRTNVYLFLWTSELDGISSVTPEPFDPEPTGSAPATDGERGGSAPDRKDASAPDRNDPAALDRKYCSGPMGMNSEGIGSTESSYSSEVHDRLAEPEEDDDVCGSQSHGQASNRTAAEVLRWAQIEGIRRRRADGGFGLPEDQLLTEWTQILDRFCQLKSTAQNGPRL